MNPILQRLNNQIQPNDTLNKIGMIRDIMSGKDPQALFQQMIHTNPQFRTFIQQNKGKSAEQIAAENGIDLNSVMNLFR